jgi:hypothetical protein
MSLHNLKLYSPESKPPLDVTQRLTENARQHGDAPDRPGWAQRSHRAYLNLTMRPQLATCVPTWTGVCPVGLPHGAFQRPLDVGGDAHSGR